MKYAIDRIENNIVILENISNNEKIEVSLDILPKNIKEGSIISKKDNEYILDLKEEEQRRKNISERFNRLKKKN